MKLRSPLAALALSLLALCSCDQMCKRLDTLYEDLPFEMEKVALPQIPKRSVCLSDFGGVGDGVTLNTEAFARAIEALAQQGGGRLIVPAGIWRTGPIALQSRIELHLDANALVVFDPNPDLYPIIDTNFEGLDVRRCTSPIHAEGATDIAITGRGIFDGSGEYWRELKRAKVGDKLWKSIVARGGVVAEDGYAWYPDEGYYKARLSAGTLNLPDPSLDENEIKRFLRPVLLSLRECERILLEGVTFQNSPCWNLHPLWCKDLTIKDINVRNPHYSTNGDGIDIDACEGVILVGSTFDVGDDAICIKSGKDADGRRHARKCRNLIISDCTVYHGHGGFVVGSEMSGGVENIKVSDCRFIGTDTGLRFKSTRGRGGVVKDIWCERNYMKDIVTFAVTFNLYYQGVAATEMKDGAQADLQPVDETTPEFRDMHFADIVCNGARQAIYINGLPEMPVRGISFERSLFVSDLETTVQYAEDVTFSNVTVNGKTL